MRIAKTEGADLAEIRIDHLASSELSKWREIVANKCLPVIVTNRAAWEGGKWTGDEDERLSILSEAELLGADYIDVELAACEKFAPLRSKTTSAKLILSHHDFERTLTTGEIGDICAKMRRHGADVSKVAMMATSALDLVPVFTVLRTARDPTVVLAMGAYGQASRVAAGAFGAHLTFASAGVGRESAPGQVTTERLRKMFKFEKVTKSTRLYGIIGNPVTQSMSPALHNAAMGHMGVDGLYMYLPVVNDVARFIREMCTLGFSGFSVTIPHKLEAMKAADHVDETARKIGAINTIVRRDDGKLEAYNTDWMAAIGAIEDMLPSRSMLGTRVVCLGAGGAGRALAFGALEKGARQVIVVNRSIDRAAELVAELGKDRASVMSIDELSNVADFDVLINSTSVGMHPRLGMPVPEHVLRSKPLVFDAVYNPLQTELLKKAGEYGCVHVSGFEMFVRQGAEQFRLWHPGVEPPMQLIRQVVMDQLMSD